ncbi:hypothetical protein HK098_006732 [Nowakowskiella sp. JEL0407]|nr:hypothetical protein HK098_006732 [Nowakowskiella sp. JEL0407]
MSYRTFSKPKLFPIFQIFGANTGVGKSVFSTSLCRGANLLPLLQFEKNSNINSHNADKRTVNYIKPVQTGYPTDSDSRYVKTHSPQTFTHDIYTYRDPVSPHLAAIIEQSEKSIPSDEEVCSKLSNLILDVSHRTGNVPSFTLLETAGGINSPTMSQTLQSDLFRRFRFPIILVGDSVLGGISTTLSSYESLLLRGFDVDCILLFGNELGNETQIQRNVDCPVLASPTVHPDSFHKRDPSGEPLMAEYYKEMDGWAEYVVEQLLVKQHRRELHINEMGERAEKSIWWPFTQHRLVNGKTMVIDSALGDWYNAYIPGVKINDINNCMDEYYDGCASWWTQSIGHGDSRLTKAAAYAAGRYGHVLFPECVHEPALELTEKLLTTVGAGWASRVFFSDNGSTAVEVGLKMAFGRMEENINSSDGLKGEKLESGTAMFDIIGFKGSYHGDTIGAMNISDPNVYNKKVNWYKGNGYWFDPPTLSFKNGHYRLKIPDSFDFDETDSENFGKIESAFSSERFDSNLYQKYKAFIRKTLEKETENGRLFGALVMEPVILGAGGMIFVDPLFQRALANVCQEGISMKNVYGRVKVPVVLDEVFVGFHRLGKPVWSAGVELLGIKPDVACFAKALTGGLIPLAVTLAREDVFECFDGQSKVDALLHGHSYTAHPIGCQVACESIDIYINEFSENKSNNVDGGWSDELTRQIAEHPKVDGIVALGSIFALELKTETKGYSSTSSSEIIQKLRQHQIFARPLGNVIYLLAGTSTDKETKDWLLKQLLDSLY